MPNCHNVNSPFIVIDGVHDAIIADANPPEIFLDLQFTATGWARLSRQRLDLGNDTVDDVRVE
jgi:hypothetical protein